MPTGESHKRLVQEHPEILERLEFYKRVDPAFFKAVEASRKVWRQRFVKYAAQGETSSSEYRAWKRMWYCFKKEKPRTPSGRRVKVSERWKDYNAFIGDLGRKPSPKRKHQLFRVNVNQDFKPGNVIWHPICARRPRLIEFNGHKDTLAGWAKITGMSYQGLQKRLASKKLSIEEVLTKPRQGEATCSPVRRSRPRSRS